MHILCKLLLCGWYHLILFTWLSIDKACQVLYKTMSIEILAWCMAFPDELLSMIAVRSMISLLSWLTVNQQLQDRRGRLLRRKWLSWPASRRRPSKTSQGSQVLSNLSGKGPAPIAQFHIGPKHGGVGKCVPFPRGFVFQILCQLIFASRLWGSTRRSVIFKYLWINVNSTLDLNTCMILKSSVFRQPGIDGSSCHVSGTFSRLIFATGARCRNPQSRLSGLEQVGRLHAPCCLVSHHRNHRITWTCQRCLPLNGRHCKKNRRCRIGIFQDVQDTNMLR